MNILVTGGSGFVARHLIPSLQAQGHQLWALSRSAQVSNDYNSEAMRGITFLKGDVITGEGLHAAMQGMDAVIHLVGIIREKGTSTFEAVHVEGTRQVLAAARANAISRYIHMSALGACPKAKSRYFLTKARAEALVRDSGLAWTIFRPSLIFGLGDEFFATVMKQLVTTAPLIPQIGAGQFLFRPIWVGDVALAFQQALSMSASREQSYDLVGAKEYTFRQLLQLVSHTMGLNKAIIPLPLAVMNIVVPLMSILPHSPISIDQYRMLLAGNTASPEKMRATFTLPWRSLEQELPAILVPNLVPNLVPK